MRIDRLEIYHVRMPLRRPWSTALGREDAIESVLLKMQSGDFNAWSETTPHASPIYTSEWAHGVFSLLKGHLGPAVVGHEFSTSEALAARLSVYKDNPHAKAALDFAWWALGAKMKRLPLYRMLGGKRNTIEVGESFGVQKSLDELVRLVGEAEEAGFRRVKLKYCRGWDIDMLAAVRSNFPKLILHIDCNAGFTLTDVDMFKSLDRFNLAAIEQPLAIDDLEGHAALSRMIETPIGLDEGVISLARVKEAIHRGACKFLFIKPARVGGLTASLQIAEYARSHGIVCSVGSGLESAIGGELNLALATVDGFDYPASVFASSRHYENDLGMPEMTIARDTSGILTATAEEVPGLQRVPCPELLKQQTLHSAVVEPLRL